MLTLGDEAVASPADHGMNYEDLTLETPDKVKIKAYVLIQRRHLPGESTSEDKVVKDAAEEDRNVCNRIICWFPVDHSFSSLHGHDLQCSCFTEMPEMWDTGYH